MNEQLELLLKEFMEKLQTILKQIEKESLPERASEDSILTKQILLELLDHEAIVPEAYKDSVGVWTWGVGVTDNSGHKVMRYKDNPQSIKRVIEVYKWLLENKYLPDVLEAFEGIQLSEEQLAAALSFHYNTGAINKAQWVKSFKAGKIASARQQFMNYRKPVEIIPRREKERDLFFDGKWSNDGKTTVYEVRKPSYTPNWKTAKRIDIRGEL